MLSENKDGRFLVSSILYLICATYYILLPHFFEESVSVSLSTRGASLSLLFTALAFRDPSTPMFHGNEVGIVPRFPSNIRCDKIPEKLAIFNTDFSILLHTT